MITEDISRSGKIAKLSPKAFALFCFLIPHFNNHGKMQAHPATIKGTCCPLIEWLSLEEIEPLLQEISTHTNVKFFKHTDGLHYLHSLSWHEHQKLRADRMGADRLPSFPSVLRDCSGTAPGLLHPEVEVEVEVEAEAEAEVEGGRGRGRGKGEEPPYTIIDDPIILDGQSRLE